MEAAVTPFAFTPNDSLGDFVLLFSQFGILRVDGLNPQTRHTGYQGTQKEFH